MNLVFSGPSGSGKGTITELLLKNPKFRKFTTCTTRKPREGEIDGFDYFFMEKEVFEDYVKKGEMFNVKCYDGHYYGSFEKDIDNINSDSTIIFQLTPDRALEMKKANPNSCLILLLPPSVETLNLRRENRSTGRIRDDVNNLIVARNFDYVVVNDNLQDTISMVEECIDAFESCSTSKFQMSNNINMLNNFIEQLSKSTLSSGVEEVFGGKVADEWDDKSRFVIYHGIKNPVTNEVLSSVNDGMKIADIGCGTGKLIGKIDKTFNGCEITGIDISDEMILNAQNRIFSGKNKTAFINKDFMNLEFNDSFDIIIFSYVLHHLNNPVLALNKARELLTDNGKILFSVPGIDYLKETFMPQDLDGRYTLDDMDRMVDEAGLFPISACRNRLLMTFNSYEMYKKYLQSIGTYQKILGYSNDLWDSDFDKEIEKRFYDNSYITGEYLTYSCTDKQKVLTRR